MNDRAGPDPLRGGRIHVYTGDGKGKTTAALGLAVRAACAGLTVYFGQFMKGRDYSELRLADRFPGLITIVQYGTSRLLCQGETPSAEDLAAARRGLELVKAAAASGEYGLVVADELNVTVHLGLLTQDDALGLLAARAPGVELVLTGRHAPRGVLEAADLVTEMREVRHYYAGEGLEARRGIEF